MLNAVHATRKHRRAPRGGGAKERVGILCIILTAFVFVLTISVACLSYLGGLRASMRQTVAAELQDYAETSQAMLTSFIRSDFDTLNGVAIRHSGNVVCRYDVATMSLMVSPGVNPIFGVDKIIENVPYGQVSKGMISAATADIYTEFYESIIKGSESGEAIYQRSSVKGWRWIGARYSTIFSNDGKPVSAVISFWDETESYEKDVAYKKWLQLLHKKEPGAYSLFRCNISKRAIFDTKEGSLLYVRFSSDAISFGAHVDEYASQCVAEQDAERFREFLNAEALLVKYRNGDRILTLEYLERLPEGGERWLRLTVDLVEYPHSTDVEAYLLFENIDTAKRAELLMLERAQTDPLTGLLNRTTFMEAVDKAILTARPNARHAFMMLDIDGFKQVNDVLGHCEGDKALNDIGGSLSAVMGRDDLVGRLGGDEFAIFLSDISDELAAANKARQICDATRRVIGNGVRI